MTLPSQSLNNLATLLQDQGDYDGARPLFVRALDIRKKAVGAEDPSTATSLNNLADLLRAQGDYEGARTLHRKERGRRKIEGRVGSMDARALGHDPQHRCGRQDQTRHVQQRFRHQERHCPVLDRQNIGKTRIMKIRQEGDTVSADITPTEGEAINEWS
jgi:hypothetical protein